MKVVTHHEITELRKLADDAQLEGKFDDAETIRALLDSGETLLEAQDALCAERLPDDPDDVVTACETFAKATKALDDRDLDAVVTACERFDDLKKALELAADEVGEEGANLGDIADEIAAEVKKLEDMPRADAEKIPAGVTANLEDIVSRLRGIESRLADTKKCARDEARK